jgi:hypothetical protein
MMHSMSFRPTFFLAAAMWASAPGCGGQGAMICTGGARMVGQGCACAAGTQWDGANCIGTPQRGACAQEGSIQYGDSCQCPDGLTWADAAMSACVALQCTGGAVAQGNECVCTEGYSWIDNQCQRNCIPGATRSDPHTCVCPPGTEPQGDVFGCREVLAGPTDPPPETPAPNPQIIRRSEQTLTCCINGARYTCPSQDAFNRCSTLDPSLCTRDGNC